MANIERNTIRIPNLPMGPLVDKDGMPTDEEQTFRQALITLLQTFMGDEGLVMPVQDPASVTQIQNNTEQTPAGTYGTPIVTATCALGTMLYSQATSYLNDQVVVAVRADNTYPTSTPLFKQFLLYDDSTLYPSAGAIAGYALTTYNGVQYKVALYALS